MAKTAVKAKTPRKKPTSSVSVGGSPTKKLSAYTINQWTIVVTFALIVGALGSYFLLASYADSFHLP